MLMIRLTRVGKKKHPTYRVVVQQKHKATSSNVLEILGHYNPHTTPATFDVKADRVQHWVRHGAQISDTVHNFFVEKGLLQGKKRVVARAKKEAPAEEKAPAETPAVAPQETSAEQKAATATK